MKFGISNDRRAWLPPFNARKLVMDLSRGAWRGRAMDDNQRNRIDLICTQIGILMEDASVLALTTRGLTEPDFAERVETLSSAVERMRGHLGDVRGIIESGIR